jgi:phage/plasmid-like protein (TIGR03299 family)
MSANVETMAYVGQVPWHGLGEEMKKGTPIMKVGKKAGILWDVDTFPLHTEVNGVQVPIESHRSLIRLDTDAVLDVVGPDYEPIQNVEILRFFDEYVEHGDMWIETCGSLQNGKIIWALAKMDASFQVGKGDENEGYVLLVNWHKYGKSGQAKFTCVRVVCNNTLNMALDDGKKTTALRMRHDRKFDANRQAQIKSEMGIARERFDLLKEVGMALAKMKITPKDAVEIASQIMGGSDRLEEFDYDSLSLKDAETFDGLRKPARRVMELYAGEGMGSTLRTAKNTGWGMLNAVTQYVDFEAGRRDQSSRLAEAWFGRGDRIKRKAFATLASAAGLSVN